MKTQFIVFGALVLSTNAFATQRLSFDQVKDACNNPANFQNQNKPANMEVTCSEVRTYWVADGAGSYVLPRMRKVTMGMTSDKYEIPGQAKNVEIDQQNGECPKFKEVIERVQATAPTTCEEILAFSGTETMFCVDVLDKMRANNPGGIQAPVDSGRTVHFCAPAQPSQPAPVKPAPGKPGKPGYGK